MNKLDELIKEYCPNGVEYKKLSDISEIKGRIGFRGYKREDQVNKGEGAISLSPSNIKNGEIDFSDCTYISWYKYEESPEIKVDINDIIFCKTASVGKTELVRYLPEKATINPQLLILKNIKCDEIYLSYCLKTSKFQNQIQKIKGLGTIPTISQKDFGNCIVPIPPLPVQKEIVSILDNFTEFTAELTAELTAEFTARKQQYDYYRNLLLVPKTGNLEYKTLSETCELVTGATPSKVKQAYWENGTIKWMSSGEVNLKRIYDTEERITELGYNNASTTLVPIHSVVIALAGQGKTRGKVAITETELCTNQSLCSIICGKELNYKYLYYYLDSKYDELRSISNGDGNRGGLSLRILNPYKIPVPPLEIQDLIVSILDRFDSLCNDISSGLLAEIEYRQKQYEYYRDKLLTFKPLN